MARGIGLIARAVVIRDLRLLVAHKVGAENTFLPGGHIETGEFAADALKRELGEELGVEAEVGEFIAVLEYAFCYPPESEEMIQEIDLVFETEISGGVPAELGLASKEKELEFLWVPIEDLEGHTLLPEPLPPIIRTWLREGKPTYWRGIESDETRSLLT